MTSQRDRLAALLHQNLNCGYWYRYPKYATVGTPVRRGEPCVALADALMARGVRFVDSDTLAAALTKGAEYVDAGTHGRPTRISHQLWLSGALASVADVVAAIDTDD